jgi:hypothetical protein
MTSHIGAYYQSYKNKKSFENTILSFRKWYPTATLVVVSDGGDDFSEFCKNHGAPFTMKQKLKTGRNLVFDSIGSILEFVKRLWDSLPSIEEPYFILLEDDVRILKSHTKPFQYTLNGCNSGECLPLQMQSILHERGYRGSFQYGACGGTVLDTVFLKAIPFEAVQEALFELPKSVYGSDQILSYLVLYFGGTIGPYEEFAEMWYTDIETRLEMGSVAFLHQFKKEYD